MQGADNHNQAIAGAGSQLAALLDYYYQRFLQEADTIAKEQKIIADALRDLTDQTRESAVRKFIDKL